MSFDTLQSILKYLEIHWESNSQSGSLLEITWKQARNEIFKVHEMEQLY
jgi:hypothetical protein